MTRVIDGARLTASERRGLLNEIAAMVAAGELRLGDAARVLRSSVLGMDRATFARAIKVAPRAIARLEDLPDANPTLETLKRVFAPFGGRIGLLFPNMQEPAAPTEEQARTRQLIRDGLAKSRRPRRTQAR